MGLRVRGPSFDSCLGLIWERGVDQAPNPPVEASPHRGELPRSAKIAFGKVRRYRPVRSNQRGPVAVYRIGLTGNRWKPIKFKIKFKIACSIGSDRLTGQFDRFTDRFD